MSDSTMEVRNGHISKEEGLALIKKFDGEFPDKYFDDVLEYIEMKKEMDKNNIQVLKRVNNIWREAENQTALILLLQALTGARWGEIAALTVADINLKKCSINISKSRSAKRGTVSLTKSGHLRSNEADMGTRVVYFAPSFAKEIKTYISKNKVSKDGYLSLIHI